MSHNLDNEDTAVGCSCRMDPVDRICCNVYSTLEAECHIRSPQVIVDGLRQCDDIEPFFSQKVGRLVCAVSSENNKAVQVQLMICMLHSLYLVKTVLIRYSHQFERLSGCTEDRTAPRQDS